MEQHTGHVEINERLQNALGVFSTQLRSGSLLNAYRDLDWNTSPMLRLFLTQMNSYWNWGSLTDLGKCYFYGNLVSEDKKKALELYQAASAGGDDSACFELAEYYYFAHEYMKAIEEYEHCLKLDDEFTEDGLGLINARLGDSYTKLASPDLHKACSYLQIAAEKYKNAFAARRLWQIYLDEDPQHLKVQTILNYLQLGAKLDDELSIVYLGRAYLFGNEKLHIKKDNAKAEEILLAGEHTGYHMILADLGFLYLHAEQDSKVKSDVKKAITYLDRAVELEPEMAIYHSELGYACYMLCEYVKAEDHLLFAYANGQSVYAFCLGLMYQEGMFGIERNYELSARFYKIALDRNGVHDYHYIRYAETLDALERYDEEWALCERALKETNDIAFVYRKAALILRGKSDKASIDTALAWAETALKYDPVRSDMSFVLANYYVEHPSDTEGKFSRHEKALNYYKIAFESGKADAAVYIGRLYERKLLSGSSLELAYQWYKKAADAGSARGKAEVECFEKVAVDPFGLIMRMRRVKKVSSGS